MLAIRLRRTGSKKRPFFRVVVTDSRTARDSSFVEVVGHYNPRTKPETLDINRERLEHWVKLGARPSDTIRTLVARMPPAPAEPVAHQHPPDGLRRSVEALAKAEQPAP
jgi:small subunit ribosomal protein S16